LRICFESSPGHAATIAAHNAKEKHLYKRTLAIGILSILLLSSNAAFAASKSMSVPVAGTFVDSLGGTGTFSGVFQITQFVVSNDQAAATGILSGTLTNSAGTVVGTTLKTVTIPVSVDPTSTCEILHLDLGPIALDLLGLQVNLSQVVLDITAQAGSGNLVGNLLCAVAHLLDGVSVNVTTLVGLLNQILQALLNVI
jgi:hypothetical protein